MAVYHPLDRVPWETFRVDCGDLEVGVRSTELSELSPSLSVEVNRWMPDCCCVWCVVCVRNHDPEKVFPEVLCEILQGGEI